MDFNPNLAVRFGPRKIGGGPFVFFSGIGTILTEVEVQRNEGAPPVQIPKSQSLSEVLSKVFPV